MEIPPPTNKSARSNAPAPIHGSAERRDSVGTASSVEPVVSDGPGSRAGAARVPVSRSSANVSDPVVAGPASGRRAAARESVPSVIVRPSKLPETRSASGQVHSLAQRFSVAPGSDSSNSSARDATSPAVGRASGSWSTIAWINDRSGCASGGQSGEGLLDMLGMNRRVRRETEHLDRNRIGMETLPRQDLVERRPQRVDVGLRTRGTPGEALRRHVGEAAHRGSRAGPRLAIHLVRTRNPEVEELDLSVPGQPDVARFDVAMHQAERLTPIALLATVGDIEGLGDVLQHLRGCSGTEDADDLVEVDAIHELGDQTDSAVEQRQIVGSQDARMAQRREESAFVAQAE